jgi:CRP-like cAMP-binding protein
LFRDVDGHAQPLGTLEKGDFFGEMSILEGLPRTVAAEAVEDAELIEINSTIFDKMIRSNIEIAIRMLRKLSIRLREAELKVSELQASGARPANQSRVPRSSSMLPAETCQTGVRLELDGQGVAYAVSAQETLIGRYDPVTEQKPDIDLTDQDLKRTVSRRHVRVLRSDQGYAVVEEVGALQGTSVNGTQLVTGERHPLVDGDHLTVGSVSLIFRT